jgi:hypothetical protein
LTPEMRRIARELERLPINIVTPPRAEKWRVENRAAVERVLPLIADVERRLGYDPVDLSPDRGPCAGAEAAGGVAERSFHPKSTPR